MRSSPLLGIHHVTALSRRGDDNVRFHAGTLGLRTTKRTVNFDDPTTWHLYFGDGVGSPGTSLTYFPHPMAALTDRDATSQTLRTVFTAPPGTLGFWRERLERAGIAPADEHGELVFEEPDGARLGIAEGERTDTQPWGHPDLDADHQLRGFERVIIGVPDLEETAEFLTGTLGFGDAGETAGGDRRFTLGDGAAGQRLDVRPVGGRPSRLGSGSVHHVAWRVADPEDQLLVREQLVQAGLQPTGVVDRDYFLAVYCRIPGGLIFEFSTDGPGFAIDEAEADLGHALQLPAQYQPQRAEIERQLRPTLAEMDAAMADVAAGRTPGAEAGS